jgi:hypothetical protein
MCMAGSHNGFGSEEGRRRDHLSPLDFPLAARRPA